MECSLLVIKLYSILQWFCFLVWIQTEMVCRDWQVHHTLYIPRTYHCCALDDSATCHRDFLLASHLFPVWRVEIAQRTGTSSSSSSSSHSPATVYSVSVPQESVATARGYTMLGQCICMCDEMGSIYCRQLSVFKIYCAVNQISEGNK